MSETSAQAADMEFFWDPVCPFAWITSRWIVKVVEQSDYSVDWRFISLRLLNTDKNYDTDFPAGYEHGHTAGLRMLRVAARVRQDVNRDAMGPLYTELSGGYFDVPQPQAETVRRVIGTVDYCRSALERAGLDPAFAESADDASFDDEIATETELALSRTGRDVGTPIISFQPPDGVSFFGPVISRVPSDEQAIPLWNAVTTLAAFPGFAEMKRSLREKPQLAVLGTLGDDPGLEDWQGGARAAHLPTGSATPQ